MSIEISTLHIARTLTQIERGFENAQPKVWVHSYIQIDGCWYYEPRFLDPESYRGPPTLKDLADDFADARCAGLLGHGWWARVHAPCIARTLSRS